MHFCHVYLKSIQPLQSNLQILGPNLLVRMAHVTTSLQGIYSSPKWRTVLKRRTIHGPSPDQAKELSTLTRRLEESAKHLGMQTSAEKGKVMSMGSSEKLETICCCNSSLAQLMSFLRDKNKYMKTRIALLQALVRSVFLYGCKICTLNAKMEKRISAYFPWLQQAG